MATIESVATLPVLKVVLVMAKTGNTTHLVSAAAPVADGSAEQAILPDLLVDPEPVKTGNIILLVNQAVPAEVGNADTTRG